MTPQNAKELLSIITAFANGETIQVRIGDEWQDRGVLGFNLGTSQYRIKPVPHDDKWAMQQMKAGKKVRRRGWQTDQSVHLLFDVAVEKRGDNYRWNYEDSTATDWEIAE